MTEAYNLFTIPAGILLEVGPGITIWETALSPDFIVNVSNQPLPRSVSHLPDQAEALPQATQERPERP